MTCAICEKRRAKRFCPGVRGDICSLCCGTEREVTVDCPFDCEFLLEARRRERPQPMDPSLMPNMDIPITEKFLHEHGEVVTFLAMHLAMAGASVNAIDSDLRDALDALVKTYRTLQSGVIYEALPVNAIAAQIYQDIRAAMATLPPGTRDNSLLGVLAFLQRIEYDRNNGRRRGRAFLHFLIEQTPRQPVPPAAQQPSLIVP